MFSHRTTPKDFTNTTNTIVHFGFVFEENSVMIIVTVSFTKSSVFVTD